jgi:hypothetical protein
MPSNYTMKMNAGLYKTLEVQWIACMLLELVVLEMFNTYLSDYGSVLSTQGKWTSDP